MTLLLVLWWSSIALALIALGWMAGLIIARLFRENSEKRRQIDRRALSLAHLNIMNGTGDAALQLAPFQHRGRLMAETLLEVLGLVRGAERDTLIAAMVEAGVDDRLRARLKRGSRTGRLAAVEALSAFPSDDTRIALRALYVATRDPEVRIAAARTLIDLGDPPRVLDMVRDRGSQAAAASLLYAPVLRRLAIGAPDEALAALTEPDLGVGARAVLIDAVGASGDYRALPTLSLLAVAPEVVLRVAALRALGAMGHPGAAGIIATALSDEAWDVRAEAAVVAGKIGTTSLVPALAGLLDDPVWWVRFRAADALARLGREGIETLRIATTSPAEVARRSASIALAEQGLA